MRVLTRSILVVSCVLLLLTLGARRLPWTFLSASPAPAVTASTAVSPTEPVFTGAPTISPGVVVPGPTVVTTKCHEKGDLIVCHTYLAPTSGVILTRSHEHLSTAAP